MALTFQYNKTFLQLLNKGLKVRISALPILVAKESALRVEVKKAREAALVAEKSRDNEVASLSSTFRLWNEFPENLVSVKHVVVDVKKIAGVRTPVLRTIEFTVEPYSLLLAPVWIPAGVEALKRIARATIEIGLLQRKVDIMEYARKKTTQKVNLYEKVQIPEYLEAIRKIKRFMEDEDNLSKSSQKILKTKIAALEAG